MAVIHQGQIAEAVPLAPTATIRLDQVLDPGRTAARDLALTAVPAAVTTIITAANRLRAFSLLSVQVINAALFTSRNKRRFFCLSTAVKKDCNLCPQDTMSESDQLSHTFLNHLRC